MFNKDYKVVSWYWYSEMCKIKISPYYFATSYLKINGEKFETRLLEQTFNEYFLLLVNKNERIK